MPATVKQRARDAARLELANAAFAFIVERNFDALTVDEIATAIGMSRATFFRQFGTKEGAVVASVVGARSQFADAYRAGAEETCGSRWDRLRLAVEPAVAVAEHGLDHMRRKSAFLAEHPAISAKLRAERAPQILSLADAMVERGEDPLASRILATAAVAALDQCFVLWIREDAGELRDLVDKAFAALGTGGEVGA